jgi:hypothetical protein
LTIASEDRTLYAENSGAYVYITFEPMFDTTEIPEDEIRYIGGTTTAIAIPTGSYVYVKSHQPEGKVFHLPKGMKDPDKDMATVNAKVDDVLSQLISHVTECGNVHSLTREDLDVHNLPNATSDDTSVDSSEVLLTTRGGELLRQLILTHLDNKENPHTVTKAQVGLGSVNDFRIALDDNELMDTSRNDLYATIKHVHQIIYSREQLVVDIKPNTVVQVPCDEVGSADIGICDPAPKTLLLTENTVVCPIGLQVAYCDGIRHYLSQTTTEILSINKIDISPSVNPVPGYHYIYVDIDDNGSISHLGHTTDRPYYGKYPIDGTMDFFDVVTNTMYNSEGQQIYRVYLGKIYIEESNVFSNCVPVPKGSSYITRASVLASPNQTYIFDNPFFEAVDIIPKIFINGQWCDPKWNDQAGVRASYDFQRPDHLIVQTGTMGIAMPAISAGNAFTSESVPTTVTTDAPLLLEIYKRGV